jgi:hypothetical protein
MKIRWFNCPEARCYYLTAAMMWILVMFGSAGHASEHQAGSITEKSLSERVHLYFADADALRLRAEDRNLSRLEDTAADVRQMLEALIAGPRSTLTATLPASTPINATFYNQSDQTAYVDLGGAVTESFPGGAATEMLAVYSIVNTLIVNNPAVRRVHILIDGNEADTLGGHFAIRRPHRANMFIVR